ncbi:MAG: glycosyltransferase family 4 protein [Acidimicrobiales bacterium]
MTGDSNVVVGLNLLFLRPGIVGGSESYATRLIDALSAQASTIEARPICTALAQRAHPKRLADALLAPRGFDRPAARTVLERTWLPRMLRTGGFDLVHHVGGTLPTRSELPAVVTVHDLQPLDLPHNFSAVKRRWLAHAIPQAIRGASVVTTPSDLVASQIVERFGIDPARVIPVPVFAPPSTASSHERPSSRVESLLGRGPVFLYPAMTLAHKNHKMLFEAFGAAHPSGDASLVCVGSTGRDDASIREVADRVASVHMLGHVPTADLSALLTRATAVVFPSRYEGFGLPVLEAQRAETPVIASSAGAIPEVAGDGAMLLDPDDVDGWAAALADPPAGEARRRLVDAGRRNAERYGPKVTAEAQLAAYRLAVERS